MAEGSLKTMVLLFIKLTERETPFQSKGKHRYHAIATISCKEAVLLMVHLNWKLRSWNYKKNGLVRTYSVLTILDTLELRYWHNVDIKKIKYVV